MSQDHDATSRRLGMIRRIIELRDTIARTERERAELNAAFDTASRTLSERRRAVRDIEDSLRAFDGEVHRRSAAVLLNGTSPRRGTLALGNDTVRFAGWRGRAELPLRTIVDIQVGTTVMPPRLGVPLLGKLWPGEPRLTGTLLLTVQESEDASPGIFILGGLSDAEAWRADIQDRQTLGSEVASRRAELARRRWEAQAALDAAVSTWRRARERLDATEREIETLRRQLAQTERDQQKSRSSEVDAAVEELIRAEHDAIKRLDSE